MPIQTSRENTSAILTTAELLSPADARALTDEVKADASALWTKMLGLYEGGAHTTLGYKSWAAYCEAEFEMSDARAYRILQAARVIAQLPIGSSLPATESQIRPLSQLPAEEQGEAWAEVQKRAEESKKPVTAAAVQAVVAERLPQREPTHFGPRMVYLDEILIEQAIDSYSADKVGITTRGKAVVGAIRKPFEYEGALYTAMSTTSAADHESADCYRLIPEDEFIGEKLLEVVRGGPYGSYHGLLVGSRGKQYVLCGSETTFMCYRQRKAPEPAALPERPQILEIVIPPIVPPPPAGSILNSGAGVRHRILESNPDGSMVVEMLAPNKGEPHPAQWSQQWANWKIEPPVETLDAPPAEPDPAQERLDAFIEEMSIMFSEALDGDDCETDIPFHARFLPVADNVAPLHYWSQVICNLANRVRELESRLNPSQSVAKPTQSDLKCPLCGAPDFGKCDCDADAVNAALRGETLPNPFLTRDGQAQHVDAGSRLDCIKKFDLPQLRAALQVPKLQGTVRFAVEKRIKKLEK